MYDYLIGKVTYVNQNYVILENNYVGYKLFVVNNKKFVVDKYAKLFVWFQWFSLSNGIWKQEMFGFSSISERIWFEDLLTIKGISCWQAFSILQTHTQSDLMALVEQNDLNTFITKLHLPAKTAYMLFAYLRYKTKFQTITNDKTKQALITALESLGYDQAEIAYALTKIDLSNYDDSLHHLSYLISQAIEMIIRFNNKES